MELLKQEKNHFSGLAYIIQGPVFKGLCDTGLKFV